MAYVGKWRGAKAVRASMPISANLAAPFGHAVGHPPVPGADSQPTCWHRVPVRGLERKKRGEKIVGSDLHTWDRSSLLG